MVDRSIDRGLLDLPRTADDVAGLLDEVERLRDEIETRDRTAVQQEARHRAMVDSALDAVVAIDDRGVVVEWNPAAEAMFGWSRTAALGRAMTDLIIPMDQRTAHRDGLSRHLRDGSTTILGQRLALGALRADGTLMPVELTITRTQANDRLLFVGHIRDLRERREAERALAHAAEHDLLTGLLTRTGLEQRLNALQRVEASPPPLGVLAVDVDAFAEVNATFGHEVGDGVLRDLAERLGDRLPPGALLGRIAGDEFVVAVVDATSERMDLLIDVVRAGLGEVFVVDGMEVHFSASMGWAVGPDDGLRPEELVSRADAALSRAKASGVGGHQRWSSPATGTTGRLSMRASLRRGLRDGDVTMVYQPLVDLRTGAVTGVEALARWTDPELGAVSPAVFVALAEQSGLVHDLGEVVMRQVGADLDGWSEDDVPHVAVNVSPMQLGSPRFTALVSEVLDEQRLAPHRVMLEVTESTLMMHADASARFLHELREMGVWLAIDDFGTGYSSLARLGDLPVDVLKIDRSFVAALPGRRAEGLLQAFVATAAALEMTTVGEGVETAEERRVLERLGCDVGQGWLFARPVPAASLLDTVARLGARAR